MCDLCLFFYWLNWLALWLNLMVILPVEGSWAWNHFCLIPKWTHLSKYIIYSTCLVQITGYSFSTMSDQKCISLSIFRLFKLIHNISQYFCRLHLHRLRWMGMTLFLMLLRHLVVATALFVQHLHLLFLVQREVNSAVKRTVYPD